MFMACSNKKFGTWALGTWYAIEFKHQGSERKEMIIMARGLVNAALAAKMWVPRDPESFDPEKFPHWEVFCIVQLGKPMITPNEHFENAKVVASVPKEKIKEIKLIELIELGLSF